MQDWTDPRWRAEVDAWIHDQLDQLDLPITGSIGQPHLEPWATVLRIPTEDGAVWFKANSAAQGYEAGVVEVLARRRPDAVPRLLGVEKDRGWILMADGGTRLRELVTAEADLGRWLDVLPAYAQLQVDLAPEREAFLAAGAPDRGLGMLPGAYEDLLTKLPDLPREERARFEALVPWVRERAAELAAIGVPETIQHDDLHDGQVFVRDGGYLFFDWGDSCVSHPFFTMSVTLEGVISWGMDDVENSVDLAPFRDAYLEPFTAYASRPELDRGFAIALRLGWICRALDYQATAEVLGPPYADEYRDAVPVRLGMFTARVDQT